MTELRWREVLSAVEYGGKRPVVKTLLEYRQYDTSTAQWSEWVVVPTIQQIGSTTTTAK